MEAFAKAGGAPKREKLSKQERRAKQDAQRGNNTEGAKPKKAEREPPTAPTGARLQYDDAKKIARRSKASVVVRTQAQKQVEMFSHLPQYERESSLSSSLTSVNRELQLHTAILSLGLQYAEGKISGGNARCVAMLSAFKLAIADYVTPPNQSLPRDLDKWLRPLIQYLIDCRPHSVSMGNAIRSLRNIVGTTSPELSEVEAKKHILSEIDDYIQNRILLATQAVARHAQSKIEDGDVILTYARSNAVEQLLIEVVASGKKRVRVVVVDSRPHFEGKKLVRALSATAPDIACTYLHLNGLAYIMPVVTKVFLGASAFMSNGVAVARAGTAVVAMAAHDANVPVLFCCETYKFSDRVQLDAITHNELRDPDELVSSYCTEKRSGARTGSSGHVLSDWRDLADLRLLNLVYDVTPIECVSMVVTELGLVPPTSVPAILREYSKDGLVDVGFR